MNKKGSVLISLLLCSRFVNLKKQTGILFSDYLVDLGEPLLGLLDTFTEVLIFELDDFFQLLIVFLVQVQMQDLDIFELRRIVEAQLALPV